MSSFNEVTQPIYPWLDDRADYPNVGVVIPPVTIGLLIPRLEDEREDRQDDEEDDDPLGDIHTQPGNATGASDRRDHRDDQEEDREANEVPAELQGTSAAPLRIVGMKPIPATSVSIGLVKRILCPTRRSCVSNSCTVRKKGGDPADRSDLDATAGTPPPHVRCEDESDREFRTRRCWDALYVGTRIARAME